MSRITYTAVLASILAVLTAAPASAKPGEADFTPAAPSYRYEGVHGIFTGDAVYDPSNNRLLWSLRLSESVQAIVRGDMSCSAYVEGKRGYSDNHPVVPSNYQLHSIVPGLQLDTQYRLIATCGFTAQNGSTTAPGKVDYSVVFTLHSK